MDLLSARLGLLNRFIPFGRPKCPGNCAVLIWHALKLLECIYCGVLIELGRWVMDLVYRRRFDLIQSWWHSMKCKGFQAVCYLSVYFFFFFKRVYKPHTFPWTAKFIHCGFMCFPGGSAVKEPTCNSGDMAGDEVLIPLGNEMAACCGILAWEVPWTALGVAKKSYLT